MTESSPTVFTSESVTEGHPDKVADQISDAILDAILAQDPVGRVACETLVTTGLAIVAGEVTTSCYVDVPRIVRETIRDIGYTRAKYGFDYETCGVLTSIHEQSPDIARGVDPGGAGDQGMMVGFACTETEELMPLPILLAHRLCRQLARVRKEGIVGDLRPDGKSQVTVEYREGRGHRIDTVVISSQHTEEILDATGERITDAARHVAKNIVGAGLAREALVQLAYAIGVADPVSVMVDTAGTGVVPDDKLTDLVREVFPLTPRGIIKELDLLRPIYRATASYGHFGRTEPQFTWESLHHVAALKAAAAKLA